MGAHTNTNACVYVCKCTPLCAWRRSSRFSYVHIYDVGRSGVTVCPDRARLLWRAWCSYVFLCLFSFSCFSFSLLLSYSSFLKVPLVRGPRKTFAAERCHSE